MIYKKIKLIKINIYYTKKRSMSVHWWQTTIGQRKEINSFEIMNFCSENLQKEIPFWGMLQMKEFCRLAKSSNKSFLREKVGSWPQMALGN